MNRFWRLFLTIWLMAALSWQGVASAAMLMCHGQGAMSAAAAAPGVAHLTGHGGHHPGALGDTSLKAHQAHHPHASSAHPHEPAGAAPAAQVFLSAPGDESGAAGNASTLEGGLAAHACAVCACCAHALGLVQAPAAWPDRVAPVAPAEVPSAPVAQRSASVPDKPPRA